MFNSLIPLVSQYREQLISKGITNEEIEKKIMDDIQISSEESMQELFMTFEEADITAFEKCLKEKDIQGMEVIFKKYNLDQNIIESKVCENFKKKMLA